MLSDCQLTREWVAIYRERGLQPLPSDPGEKKPMMDFAEFWDRPLPYDPFERVVSRNVQVMTGRPWRLLVIDLDGPEARERWSSMGRTPRTWVTHSGGNGVHLWFRIPADLPPMPKAFLWKGNVGHSAIERLCDRSLVMAPPSIHPKTGARYRFRSKGESPLGLPYPADCPAWILRLAPVQPPRSARAPRRDWRPAGHVPSLVASWGIRIAGPPSRTGWIPCHAIGREDRHPSAAIHCESGYYVDHGSGERMNLAALAVRLGIYIDTREAMQCLAS